jgi:glycosyltransferase involved in cell wall biosynthesis
MSDPVTPTPPARILFVDHTAELSGGELALLNIIRHLDRQRYEPVVVLFSDGPLVGRLAEAKVRTILLQLAPGIVRAKKDGLGLRSLMRLGAAWGVAAHVVRLARLISHEQVDLVHTNSLKADVIGGLAARVARRPVVWHVHDRIEAPYLPAKVASFFRRLARRIPSVIVANSQSTLETLRLPATIPTAVAPPGLNPEYATAPPRGIGSASAPVIGIVGRLAPWKGQHVFLEAAARVRNIIPSARFMIVGASLFGEREYERSLHDLARILGLEEQVHFTGHRGDVRDLMASFDVLVHASTTPEPFGQVITEAMAVGTPVVASDGGGVREIITNGQTGLLVPMGDTVATADAILKLLQNSHLASALASGAREMVGERFSIDVTIETLCGVYESILQPRAAATTSPADAADEPPPAEAALHANFTKRCSH